MSESLRRQNSALSLNGDRERKFPPVGITNEKWEHTVLNRRKSRWYPKNEVWGSLLKKLQGEKGQHVSKKGKRALEILT